MQPAYNHRLLELTSLPGARLADAHGLSAMVVAAAGAVGMPTLGPPVVHDGPGGIVIALLCREGHIVLHTAPSEGLCVVDLVARAPADVGKGVEVIARRLGVPTEQA